MTFPSERGEDPKRQQGAPQPIRAHLHADVTVSRCLLQGAELCLASGRRYGLIGRNGLGKTTLLKMLASRNLRVPAHISILHVEQEVAGDETVALQSVLQSDTLREGLLDEERRLNARIANGT